MGVDVEMKARLREPLTADEFEDLRDNFRETFPDQYAVEGARYPDLVLRDLEPGVLVLETLHRFYGIGYERGHWPEIQRIGDWLAVRLGERAELRYGSDSGYTDWASLTPWAEARAENAAHWEAQGNEPYRRTSA